ncbi:hypothetical protein MKY30_16265 [Oceanobacillus sp. FSL W8-0428]|uniref:hypothetical protein n=1 Tax=Oceanobacillus sp. FSL W8-0428 TaxID=2921715 RepID=UPI0030F7DD54
MPNEIFLRSYISTVEGNFQILKRLEEGKGRRKIDKEKLSYYKGCIETCELILDFEKELNANEK